VVLPSAMLMDSKRMMMVMWVGGGDGVGDVGYADGAEDGGWVLRDRWCVASAVIGGVEGGWGGWVGWMGCVGG
jgi:hypothetical protein